MPLPEDETFHKPEIVNGELGEQLSPVEIVQKYITQMWQHPLLDETTRQHRRRGPKLLTDFAHELEIGDGEWYGIPFGSTLWITDEQSDHDYAVYAATLDADTKWKRYFSTNSKEHARKHGKPLPDTPLDILSEDDYRFQPHLYFTPDDYLVGNVELAQQQRLARIKAIATHKESGNYFPKPEADGQWETIRRHVAKMLNWPQTQNKEIDQGRSSAVRFRRNRDTLLEQNIGQDLSAFNAMRYNVPYFSTYHAVILATKGALPLNPRFAYRGIR